MARRLASVASLLAACLAFACGGERERPPSSTNNDGGRPITCDSCFTDEDLEPCREALFTCTGTVGLATPSCNGTYERCIADEYRRASDCEERCGRPDRVSCWECKADCRDGAAVCTEAGGGRECSAFECERRDGCAATLQC